MENYCLRRYKILNKSPINELIRAFKSLGQDIHRNSTGLQRLKNAIPLYPQIKDALEVEKEIGLQLIDLLFEEISSNNTCGIVRLGGYWMEILGNPDLIDTKYGQLKVECYESDCKEHSSGYGDGHVEELNTDRMLVHAITSEHLSWRKEMSKYKGSVIK